jgi:hypothetical protein
VPAPCPFSYSVLRVVPRVEREEFLNVGVVLFCHAVDFLGARVTLDEQRLLALAPDADVPLIRRHIEAVPRICAGGAMAGPIGALSTRERWQWLIASRSTVLQTSPAHSGLCARPEAELDRLLALLVKPTSALK